MDLASLRACSWADPPLLLPLIPRDCKVSWGNEATSQDADELHVLGRLRHDSLILAQGMSRDAVA